MSHRRGKVLISRFGRLGVGTDGSDFELGKAPAAAPDAEAEAWATAVEDFFKLFFGQGSRTLPALVESHVYDYDTALEFTLRAGTSARVQTALCFDVSPRQGLALCVGAWLTVICAFWARRVAERTFVVLLVGLQACFSVQAYRTHCRRSFGKCLIAIKQKANHGGSRGLIAFEEGSESLCQV